MSYRLLCFIVFLYLFVSVSCAFAKDKVYNGRVIDSETKKPIEGVIVVATWLKELIISTEESIHSIYDVQETLTDRDGRWSLSIPEGKIDNLFLELIPLVGKSITEVVGPHFTVFKPGYCSWPEGFMVNVCIKNLKPAKDNGFIISGEIIVELPKLTNKEDRRKSLPVLIYDDREKNLYMKERRFIKLINAERRYLGLQEYEDLKEFEE